MGNYRKGLEARNYIIREARTVFNQSGWHLTLGELADRLQISKGRITNYFPTKDDLFIALSQDYDLRYQQMMASFTWPAPLTFSVLKEIFSIVMDFQYDSRCVITFAAATNSQQTSMFHQVTESYRRNGKGVHHTLDLLIDAGLIKPNIKRKEEFEVFNFQHINLFTTWVISLEIYDNTKAYKQMKPIYMKGFFRCFYPYLTTKGKTELEKIKML